MSKGGFHIEIRGTVQGVGYRPWVYQLAERLGIGGRVWNDSRGVAIDAYGETAALDRFLFALQDDAPLAAQVKSVRWQKIGGTPSASFAIDESRVTAERSVSIPPDLPTCPDCLRELFDAADRRYRYPFINCTNCGPRYSIATGIPYDRPNTSMASFVMCPACLSEYRSSRDRRFHAQPNACRQCGPRLRAVTPRRQEISTHDPIGFAIRAIDAGLIVAVKGIGGFHLACDATSSQAVKRLRERKQREGRPFAVMVPDLASAELHADLTVEERGLLMSTERPIVLASRRSSRTLADEVCGESPLVGLFLPYSPLHHLLMHEVETPFVMTSGNRSDEPMAIDNDDALERLVEIADLFLIHDRPIVNRVDDSVVRVIAGAPAVLRRARGYVPRSLELRRPVSEPILACGADLKNAFCLAAGSSAFLGPHVGDLETVPSLQAFEDAIERVKTFVGVEPTAIAHDLHPDYFSTRYALARSGVRTVAVQHHHAHIVSAMAEHQLEGTVVGVAYDGTGFGTDGTSWGGEILIANAEGFTRFATFRPIALAGGEKAIREPWRAALALLEDAFGGDVPLDRFPVIDALDPNALETVRRMIACGFNTTPARGVGRYFDAFGALFLQMPVARYEGEVAFQWNVIAEPGEKRAYPILIREGSEPWVIDPRPMVRQAVHDFLAGVSPRIISARFHNALAGVTIEVVRAALAIYGQMPVVLGGGCFQNARLAGAVTDGLLPQAPLFMNRAVPAGDGGIALGQVLVADAQLRCTASALPAGSEVPVCV